MKRSISALILGVFFSVCGSAQNLRQDMLQMYDAYGKLKYFSASIDISVYKNMNDTKPAIVKRANVKKSGNMYFSQLDDISMLVNDKYIVYVSGNDKLIYYRERGKSSEQDLKSPFKIDEAISMLDSALKRHDTIQYMGTVNGIKQYTIRTRTVISVVDIYIDNKTHLITKMVYYYNKDVMKTNNKVAIVFKNMLYDVPLPKQEFSETIFLKRNGNDFLPSDAYRSYEVYHDKSFEDEIK